MNNIPGRHLTVFNSQSLLQVGGQWNENKQTLDLPFQVWICHSMFQAQIILKPLHISKKICYP